MLRDKTFYRDLADKMARNDERRDQLFSSFEDMYHGKWDLPAELEAQSWIVKYTASDPYDAIAAATRVLAASEPHVKYQPLAENTETKDMADAWERNLKWQLKSANRRRSVSVETDVVSSALLYQAVAMMVIDLDYQMQKMKKLGMDTRRYEMVRRYSRFLVKVFNPKQVHVERSDYMSERVLLRQVRTAQSVIDEWGDLATDLQEPAKNNKSVLYNDLYDGEYHTIYCTPDHSNKETWIIPPANHDLTFLPWVAMMGGSMLEEKEEDKYHSILYSSAKTNQWKLLNIQETLLFSETITRGGAPRVKVTGPDPDSIEVDYSDPARPIRVPAGHDVVPFPPPEVDTAALTMADRLRNSMNRSTVSNILLTGDVASGTAFSTMALQTQIAVGALKPSKVLAEQALSEMFTLMLLWTKHSDIPLLAYGNDKRVDLGTNYMIMPDEIQPDAIYIDVELSPDEPTDRQARANTATQLVQWGLSKERALETMGIADTQQAIEDWYLDKLKENELDMLIKQRQWELDRMIQQDQMQMQMDVQGQQAAMAQQQAQQQAAMQMADQQQMESGIPGGAGFNAGMGGQAPTQAIPGLTNEALTGADRFGNEITGLEV
jgi:hypothetical protein